MGNGSRSEIWVEVEAFSQVIMSLATLIASTWNGSDGLTNHFSELIIINGGQMKLILKWVNVGHGKKSTH